MWLASLDYFREVPSYRLHRLVFVTLIVFMIVRVDAQRFPCDGRIMISAYDGQSTRIYYPVFIPFGTPFMVPIVRYAGRSIDAVGFNAKDFYLYGVDQVSREVVRMGNDGTIEPLGTLSIDQASQVLAGDCTPDGRYMCYDRSRGQLQVYEVVGQYALSDRVDLYWDSNSGLSGPFASQIFDFAIDPENPAVAYAYQGVDDTGQLGPPQVSGHMLSIDIDPTSTQYGMVTPLAQLSPNRVSHLGALLTTAGSQLYGFGTLDEGINPSQRVLYSFNPFDGGVGVILSASFTAELSDGCACPYSFSFTLLAPAVGIFCNNDVQTFELTISNNSFNTISGVRLRDTFPDGMIIEFISDTYEGTLVTGTGVGSNILALDDLVIPAKSRVEIQVDIRTIDAAVGERYNQAVLYDLPERFGGPFRSDDPYTTGVQGDSSYFVVTARALEDVDVDVRLPSDCLLADDGGMTVRSDQLVPGQVLEVGLRNQDGWTVSWHTVTIDDRSSFTIDSLLPGAYQLFRIRSLADNCSLALKDTIITIEPPHDQLQIDVNSNAAICAGDTLRLFSAVTPAGDVLWSGPTLWSSDLANPIVEMTDEAWSGDYKAVATYGYCEQEIILPVDIKPLVTVTVVGDEEYCLRDTLALAAETGQDSLSYRWSGPSYATTDSLTESVLLEASQGGQYQVIADNGACSDTTVVTIGILPTPTVTMPTELFTDFCEDVVLRPLVVGGGDVSFEWSPAVGLTCEDCPVTNARPPVQSRYQVRVANDWCSDSATVDIVLDKATLLTAPNVFRPTSTMGNDLFRPVPRCVVDEVLTLQVYDRWGSLVHDSDQVGVIGWDGFATSRLSATGVYIWSSSIRLVDGSVTRLTGDVLLID